MFTDLIVDSTECPIYVVANAMFYPRPIGPLDDKWIEFGRSLKIPIDVVQKSKRMICRETMYDFLKKWIINAGEPKTIGHLLDALRDAELVEIAEEFEKNLRIELEEFMLTNPYFSKAKFNARKRTQYQAKNFDVDDDIQDDEEEEDTDDILASVNNEAEHKSVLGWCTTLWLSFMQSQTNKTARDPFARRKLQALVFVLIIVFYNIPSGQAIKCDPCVIVAANYCAGSASVGGACVGMQVIDHFYCGLILAVGGSTCLASATTCTYFCIRQKFGL